MVRKTNAQSLKRFIGDGGEGFASYFSEFETLVCEHEFLRAALAFGFHLVEMAHHRLLYGDLCRLHGAHTELARKTIDSQFMTRNMFRDLYHAVFSQKFPVTLETKIKKAEAIRDKMIHGKNVTDAKTWKAIFDLIGYARGLNEQILEISDFQPFADMRGVTSRRRGALFNKETTRWMLKGMSFSIS